MSLNASFGVSAGSVGKSHDHLRHTSDEFLSYKLTHVCNQERHALLTRAVFNGVVQHGRVPSRHPNIFRSVCRFIKGLFPPPHTEEKESLLCHRAEAGLAGLAAVMVTKRECCLQFNSGLLANRLH